MLRVEESVVAGRGRGSEGGRGWRVLGVRVGWVGPQGAGKYEVLNYVPAATKERLLN